MAPFSNAARSRADGRGGRGITVAGSGGRRRRPSSRRSALGVGGSVARQVCGARRGLAFRATLRLRLLSRLLADDPVQEACLLGHDLVRRVRVGLERLTLGAREALRYVDVDQDVQIATLAGPAEVRHAAATEPDLRAGLGAALDLDGLLTLHGRHEDRCPERGLRDSHRGLVDQLGALALERRVRRDVDSDVERPGGTAAGPGLALVREADLVALVDARRDRHVQRPSPLHAALALARVAGRLDDLAVAPTSRTRGHVDHLAEHRLADAANLAPTIALGAGDRMRARLRAIPTAGVAPREDRELDLLHRAEDGLLEGDAEVVSKVRAGRRTPATTCACRRGAEERVEDVRKATEAGRALRPDRPEQVVALAALRVREDLVGLVDLLELDRGLRLLVHVGMPALREAPVGLLDVRVGRVPLDAEGHVVVDCH